MKHAIILAAGSGKRIRDIHTQPKSLLEIDGISLIRRSITQLNNHGIDHILVVTGYQSELLCQHLRDLPGVETTLNPQYAHYESLYSLYCAKDWVKHDCLLLESDILYDSAALSALIHSPEKNVILTTPPSDSGDEVFVETDQHGFLKKMSKQIKLINSQPAPTEFVGISKISNAAYQELLILLANNAPLLQQGHYEEEGLVRLAKSTPIKCQFENTLKWCEIDNQAHFHKAQQQFAQEKTTRTDDRRFVLLNPGPVTTDPRVRNALLTDDICHREASFSHVLKQLRTDISTLAEAPESTFSVIPLACSGTGAVEACISTAVAHGKKILIINNGSYGQRMIHIAKRYQIKISEISFSFRKPIALDDIEKKLKKDRDIQAVAMVHHETSTGILNPIEAVGSLCKKYRKRFIVDAMSSFGARRIDLETIGIDFIAFSANKCLHAFPGLSFVIAKLKTLEQTKSHARSYYLDLYQTHHQLETKGQMPFTPPIQLVFSAARAVGLLLNESIAQRHARYQQRYRLLKTGMESLGFTIITPKLLASEILMTLALPKDGDFDFDTLHQYCLQHRFVIYPTQLDDTNTFRLAIMGDISDQDIHRFIETVRKFMSLPSTAQKNNPQREEIS